MRIWIVSEGEPLPSDGENVRLRRMGMLSSLMSKQGHEVHWFSSTFHHYKKVHRAQEDREIEINKNLRIHLIKTNGYKKNVSFARVFHHQKIAAWMKVNSEKFKKPQIILTTLAPLELTNTMVNYAEENGIPIVVDIRDLWPEIYYEVVPSWAKRIIRPYVEYNEKKMSKMLRKTDSIIGVTPKFLQYGLDNAGIKQRSLDKVFYTSYRPQKLVEEKKAYLKEWEMYGIKEDDFVVAFLGNFGKQFEFQPILEAAAILKDNSRIKFVLCGVGEKYEVIRDGNVDLKNLILPGWIEKRKIDSLMAISSVGIAPYRKSRNFSDNTPNKFGEYLSASLPILLSIEGVMADLLKEYQAGLLYGNGDTLSVILKNLSEDEVNIEKMSKQAKLLFDDKFNADCVYQDLSLFLSSIANKDRF